MSTAKNGGLLGLLLLLSKLHIISFTGNSCVYHQGFAVRMQQQSSLCCNSDVLNDYFRENLVKNVTLTAQHPLLSPYLA